MSSFHVKPTRHLFVNAAGWSFDFDSNKYFTTITAALAAASALSPVPSNINPVLIHVFPGRYTESPTMSVNGVHIAAIPQQRAFATQIVGTVTVSLGAGIDRDINFVSISGISMTRLVFTGANPQKLYLIDCAIENGAASITMVMDNTGVDTGTRRSQVIADNLTVTNSNAGAFACISKTGGDLEIFHGFIRKTPDTAVAFDVPGVGTPGSGFTVLSNVDIDGRVTVSGNGNFTAALSDFSSASAVAATITSTSTGTIVVGDITVASAFATAAISVAGVLVSGKITFTSTGTVITAGVYVGLTAFDIPYTYVRSVAVSGAVTSQDQILLGTGGGGGITLTLPTAASMFRRTLTFKKVDAGAGGVTIDGSGAETIDGAATQTLAAQFDFMTIYSDGTTWWIISQ